MTNENIINDKILIKDYRLTFKLDETYRLAAEYSILGENLCIKLRLATSAQLQSVGEYLYLKMTSFEVEKFLTSSDQTVEDDSDSFLADGVADGVIVKSSKPDLSGKLNISGRAFYLSLGSGVSLYTAAHFCKDKVIFITNIVRDGKVVIHRQKIIEGFFQLMQKKTNLKVNMITKLVLSPYRNTFPPRVARNTYPTYVELLSDLYAISSGEGCYFYVECVLNENLLKLKVSLKVSAVDELERTHMQQTIIVGKIRGSNSEFVPQTVNDLKSLVSVNKVPPLESNKFNVLVMGSSLLLPQGITVNPRFFVSSGKLVVEVFVTDGRYLKKYSRHVLRDDMYLLMLKCGFVADIKDCSRVYLPAWA